jgi:hypothetical protein
MTITFEAGKTYTCSAFREDDHVYSFEVVRRTAKMIWTKRDGKDKEKASRVRLIDGVEVASPMGRYSMSPTIWASQHEKDVAS